MKYYVKRRKFKVKPYLLVIFTILVIFNIFLYVFDKRVFPAVLLKSENIVQAKTVELISQTSVNLFKDEFNYDEMVNIEKDSQGNISLIRANTVKLNYLSSELAIECNKQITEMGNIGVSVPIGWMSGNSAIYNLGPNMKVKIEPVGNMNVTYDSKFESAGINQTRHKIYLKVNAKVRILVPLNSEEIEVNCEIPVSETIIVGKIPDTAIDFGSKNN